MHDRSSATAVVDDAWLDMFTRKQKPYELCCSRSNGQLKIQCTVDWGLTKNCKVWKIIFIELLSMAFAESCKQLTKRGCTCRSECRGRCTFYSRGHTCSPALNCVAASVKKCSQQALFNSCIIIFHIYMFKITQCSSEEVLKCMYYI